jgi:hypothetical protein
MTDHFKPQISSGDEPLFVLKYRRGHRFLRIFCFSLGTLFFSGFALGAALVPEHRFHELILVVLGELVFALLLLLSILQIAHLLSFREIRLYQDRIVQVRRCGSEIEIRLADARHSGNRLGFRPTRIHDQDTGWFPGLFKGISYYEDLPDPKDALKLNLLLAALSGRSVRELGEITKMERLIKKGGALRTLATSTLDNLDNEVLQAYLEEKRYHRAENKGLIAMWLFVLVLPLLILVYVGIWWSRN